MKHDIWTWCYSAFSMGGKPKRPMIAEMDCVEKYDLGKGYCGYSVINPNTKTSLIIESETGAIIGDNLETVKQDIAEADESIMKEQIKNAKKRLVNAERITADEFWKRMQNVR